MTSSFDNAALSKATSADSSSPKRPALRFDNQSFIYGIAVAGLLVVVIPLASIPGLRLSDPTVGIAYALAGYSGLQIAALIARGQPALMSYAFWTFSYSFLTLPLAAQLSESAFPLATGYTYSPATAYTVELIIVVGFAGYHVGRALFRDGSNSDPPTTERQTLNISAGRAATLAYVGVAFVALAVLQHGVVSFFQSRDALTENFLGPAASGYKFYLDANKAAGSTLQAVSQVPVFVGTYFLLLVRRYEGRRSGPFRVSALALPVLANVIINNPFSNARFWFGTVLIGFVSIYLPLRTSRFAPRLYGALFVVISLLSFQQLAAFRHSGASFVNESLASNLVTSPDYASPQQMLNGVDWVSSNGLQLGHQLLGVLFIWVPRALWAAKPGDTGQLVGAAAGFKVSAPLWTEGQVDFGLVGTFLYLAIIGFLCVFFDRGYRDRWTVTAVCTPIMSSLFVFVLRGSLQPAFGSILPVIACVVLCVRTRRPEQRTRSAIRTSAAAPVHHRHESTRR